MERNPSTPPPDDSNPFSIAPPSSIRPKSESDASIPSDPYNTGQIARGLAALHTRTEILPDFVAGFRIIRVLGEGGMGVVYEAEQQRPRRTIALKVIRPQIVTKTMLKRFEMEIAALARLQHPGIAHVYEAGADETPIGVQPYVVIELVRGLPLNAYVEQNKLDVRARLELMAKVCDAVQYAHQRGVIHRDLKPGNILVDETGQPKILDFGVAKLAADPRDGDTPIPSLQTEAGNLVGTLQYMSPEQASGQSAEVDTRSDIYALGLICYELLAGRRPYDLSKRVLPDAVRVIREDDPAPLSSIHRHFRGDVDTIIAKALAKEKERRYASASALAADIRRYLRDEPIAARRPSTAYQLAKFARRNKTLVAAAAAILLVLILGIISTSWQAMEAKRRASEAANRKEEADHLRIAAEQNARAYAAQAAELRLQVGERSLQDAWSKLEVGDYWSGLLLTVRAMQLGPQEARWQNDRRIAIASILQRVPRMIEQIALVEPLPATPADDRYFAMRGAISADQKLATTWGGDTTVRVWDLQTGKLLRSLEHAGRVNFSCFSEKGDLLLTCSADGSGRVWKLDADRSEPPMKLQHNDDVRRGAFNRAGNRVATASADGTAKLWDPLTARGTVLTGHNAPVDRVIFSDSSDLVATASRNGAIRVWSATTGEPKTGFMVGGGAVGAIAFDPKGTRVLAGYEDGTARIWRIVDASEAIKVKLPRGVSAVAFSATDGRTFGAGSIDGIVQLWDSASGRRIGDPRVHNWSVTHLSFSRDGNRLLTCSGDDPATVTDLREDQEPDTLLPQGDGVCIASFSDDGKTVTAVGWDRTIRRWLLRSTEDAAPPATQPAPLPPATPPTVTAVAASIGPRPVAFTPDGHFAATGDRDGNVLLFDLASGTKATVSHHATAVTQVAFSGDSQRLLTASAAGSVQVHDLPGIAGAAPPRTFDLNRPLLQARISHDGRLIATVSTDNTARIWDRQTGQRLTVIGDDGSIRGVAFSPAGTRIAAVSTDGAVRIFDAATGRAEASLQGATGVIDVWYSPRENQIVTAARDGVVRVWTSDKGQPLSPPLRHSGEIRSVSFSADGARMLVVCIGGPARVWGTGTWHPLTRPITHSLSADAALSADGQRVILPCNDQTTRAWDVATDQPLIAPLPGRQPIIGAGSTPDGTICAITDGGTLRSWKLQPDARPLPDLQSLAELLAARKLDSTGTIVRLSVPELQERWTSLKQRYPKAFAADVSTTDEHR